MAATEVKVRMQQRRDTAAGWTSANPVLLNGEFGFETDTKKVKLGDGSTAWNSLAYYPGFSISAYPLATADIADDAITSAKLDTNIDIAGTLDVTGVGTFDSNVTIAGDLTVNGTTTTVNSTTLQVDDKNIELGTVSTPSDTTADGGGITLKGATDKTINWVQSTGCWTFNQPTNFNDHVRIDSSGRVGIGDSSPDVAFSIKGSGGPIGRIQATDQSNARLRIQAGNTSSSYLEFGDSDDDDVGEIVYGHSDNHMRFRTNGSEQMRIDSSGRVGIGTSSPDSNSKATLYDTGTAQRFNLLQLTNQGTSANGDVVGVGFAAGETTQYGLKGSVGFVRTSSYGRGAIAFYTNNTAGTESVSSTDERMRIDSSGNVGIGTSSVAGKLHVFKGNGARNDYSTSADGLVIESSSSTGISIDPGAGNTASIYFPNASNHSIGQISHNLSTGELNLRAATYLRFSGASNTERMRIDGSGRLLVGTSSTSNNIKLLVQGSPSYNGGVLQISNTGSTLANGDDLGVIQFSDSSHTATARLLVQRDGGTWTSGSSMPTRMMFLTTADGASTATERMRIDSSGRVLVGTSSSSASVSSVMQGNSSGSSFGGTLLLARGQSSIADGAAIGFVNFSDSGHVASARINAARDGGTWTSGSSQPTRLVFSTTADGASSPTEHFRIASNGDLTATDTTIGSNSDSRLKTNIADFAYDLETFKQYQPKTFDWKNPELHGNKTSQRGFIAQDVEAIDDYWVSQQTVDEDSADAEFLDADRLAKTLKLDKKDAMYVSVIQQLLAKVETLEAKVAALEAE